MSDYFTHAPFEITVTCLAGTQYIDLHSFNVLGIVPAFQYSEEHSYSKRSAKT